MKIRRLHRWGVALQEAVAIQRKLREKLILQGDVFTGTVRHIAGADISYEIKSDVFFAAVVVLSYPDLNVIEERQVVARAPFPYIPGLLSFREAPALLKAFADVEAAPDVVFLDGQGIAHPRGLGLASHVGLFLDKPSIGCAKKKLVGVHDPLGESKGEAAPLVFQDQVVGMALRSKHRVKPIFISPGHRIGMRQALELVLSCCRGYRVPEPVRQAHLAVNRMRLSARESHRRCP